ncbi:cytochrome P450 [Novosphingobium aquae]|uniref:Cytochrome P450 n=1 Tax=Novosphingobium aquae TaxID=3133435 RepID=A0ABU8SA16_9SPHN
MSISKGPAHAPIFQRPECLDLTRPISYQNGHQWDAYARMRTDAPIFWHEQPEPYEPGFWVISRHAEISAVSKNPGLWSSANGSHLMSLGDPETMDTAIISAVVGNMVSMDPPEHTAYRRIATSEFTPRKISEYEQRIRTHCRETIDRIAAKGSCDFVLDVAQQLPLYTLSEIMGVPEEDRAQLIDWANMLTGYEDPEFKLPDEEFIGAMMQIFDYGRWAMRGRRDNPKNDLLSVIANSRIEDVELPDYVLDGFFLIMIVGGNETTRNTISGGLLALDQYPEQREALIMDPSLIPNAAEEMLRWVSPVVYFARRAKEDTVLSGQKIAAGEKVVMLYGSANRDESVFDDAERFDVRRRNAKEHLSFGVGQHFCLGSGFARLQIRVMYEELLRRLPDIRAAEAPRRMQSNFIMGIKNLPAVFTPER